MPLFFVCNFIILAASICCLVTFDSLIFGDPVDRGRFTRSPSGPSLHSEIGNFVIKVDGSAEFQRQNSVLGAIAKGISNEKKDSNTF